MTASAARDRIAATAGVFFMLFVVVIARAVYLSVILGADLEDLATRQHRQHLAQPPARGPIVDRQGEPLALTIDAKAVYLRPRQLSPVRATEALARALEIAPSVVAARANDTAPFVWLDRRVSLERWSKVAELGLEGVGSHPSRQRSYPHGSLAAHLLGFTNIDGEGLEGLERRYNADLLSEVAPINVERDARGRPINASALGPLPRGGRVELTIDATLQHAVERELTAAVLEHRAESGMAVVLDPRTGQVLALANAPTFDPNDPGSAPPAHRRNRVITDIFEPGSTFKVFTAAAALESSVIKPQERIDCENGRYRVGGRTIHDHDPYGWLTFEEIIQYSSNIGTAKIAERVGADGLSAMIEALGFGKITGVDLPGEVPGMLIPRAQWGRIHLATISFGQGIAITPIQLAAAYGAIANGGLLLRPYVVERVVGEEGQTVRLQRPRVVRRVFAPETARRLTSFLSRVVEDGTGKHARLEGFGVAGKTGTAQKVDPQTGRYSSNARMSSFVGFVPADNPQLVILVIIDTPKGVTYGGLVAAPAFRRIAEQGLQRFGLRPAPAPVPAPELASYAPQPLTWKITEPAGGMPSFLGLSMREAIVRAHRAGWRAEIEGSGVVIRQDPPPGSASAESQRLQLVFGTPGL
jgi:cell division protein FtsI (penicillin-binding protein 3)